MMLILVIGTTVAFSSCSKDNDEPAEIQGNDSSSSLVGTWKGTIEQGGEKFTTTITVKSNHTYTQQVSTGDSYSGTWNVSGNTLYLTGHFASSCTYVLSGKTLYIYGSKWSATLTRQ